MYKITEFFKAGGSIAFHANDWQELVEMAMDVNIESRAWVELDDGELGVTHVRKLENENASSFLKSLGVNMSQQEIDWRGLPARGLI